MGDNQTMRYYIQRETKGGRGLKSFKEAYSETKIWVACYMAAATNKLIRVAWNNESQKEQISLKKKAEKAMKKVKINVSFDGGSVIIGKENYTEWKKGFKKWKISWLRDKKGNKQQILAIRE